MSDRLTFLWFVGTCNLNRGAGHYFVDLGGLHLGFTLFPFPVSTANL
jgi:hypothetical protein